MTRLRSFGQLILGDFRERSRRYSFLWILLSTTFFGYLVITGKYSMRFPGYYIVPNSAWVGSLMAMFTSIMLTIVGFYLIRKTLERDRQTRVGEILAATPLANTTYMFAKFVSNYLVLVCCTTILIGAAIVMQLLGEDSGGLNAADLLMPFLVITLPVLGLVAGMAILFETIRWLRGTIGNVLYLLAFEVAIVTGIAMERPFFDLIGSHRFTSSVKQAILSAFPGTTGVGTEVGFIAMFEDTARNTLSLVVWPGMNWPPDIYVPRLIYLAIGIALTGLAILFFDRFDPAEMRRRQKKQKRKVPVPEREVSLREIDSAFSYGQVTAVKTKFSLYHLVAAELRLMLKGYHWLWYLVALGLLAAQLAAPYDIVRKFILPAAWIWPLPIWSALGTRDKRHNTEPLLLSSINPLNHQLPAIWVAGLVITLVAGSGMIIRALLAGNGNHVTALLIAILFVPTAGLALGMLTGTRKFFEVSYLMLWYIGSVNRVWAIDFIGVTDLGLSRGVPQAFLALAIILMLLTYLVRMRQTIHR